MAAASAAKFTDDQVRDLMDSAIAGTDRAALNHTLLAARFIQLRQAVDTGDGEEQRRIMDEMMIVTSTWVKLQSQEITNIKAQISQTLSGQGSKRPMRISESRGATKRSSTSGSKSSSINSPCSTRNQEKRS